MNNRKVTYARLHQVAHIPFTGELGNVFPPHNKVLDNLEMTVDTMGLYISFSFKGIFKNALIPLANVVIMVLDLEEKETTKVKLAKSA